MELHECCMTIIEGCDYREGILTCACGNEIAIKDDVFTLIDPSSPVFSWLN